MLRPTKNHWSVVEILILGWRNNPLIVPAVSPHAPYTCTEDILKACAQLAVEFDVPPAYPFI